MPAEAPHPDPSVSPEVEPGPSLGHRAARGVMWSAGQAVGGKAITTAAQITLGWLLVPEAFGLIGLAYTVTAFVHLLTAPGLDAVIMQRHRRSHLWFSPAAWMSFAAGLLGALCCLIAAPIAAAAYGSPDVAPLIAVLALSAPGQALAAPARALLESRLRFAAVAKITFVGTLLHAAVAVSLAAAGAGAYSLVVPSAIVPAFTTALLWWIARPPLRRKPRLRLWRYLLHDTGLVFIGRFAITAVAQADYIALGLFHREAIVGVYFFAFWYASQGVRLVGSAVAGTLFSALGQIQNDAPRQAAAALRAARATGLVAMPLCLLQCVTARPLFHVLFDHRWDAAVLPVQIMSIGFATDVIGWVGGSLLQAQRRFARLAVLAFGFMSIFIVAVGLAAWGGGPVAVAATVAGYYLIGSPLAFYLMVRPCGGPKPIALTASLRVFTGPWAAGLAAFLPAAALGHAAAALLPDSRATSASQVALTAAIGLALYLPLARHTMPAAYGEIRDRLRRQPPVTAA